MNQLLWYESELQRDAYVKGATLFQWGSRDPRWRTFDHTAEFNTRLRNHIIAMRGDEPVPPPDDDEDEGWPYRGGIDVSQHQGMIDWLAVSRSKNAELVVVRASAGVLADRLYHHNWINAQAMGFWCCSYHYLTAADDPAEQAWLYYQMTQKQEEHELCFLDVEDEALNEESILAFIRAWERLTNQTLGIYTSYGLWHQIVGRNAQWAPERYLWVAHWGVDHPTLPEPWTDFEIWQYSSTGTIPGIQGNVDLNWFK